MNPDDADAIDELCEAIRLTVEYVGTEALPPKPGWTWFDTLVKYRPELAQHFVDWHNTHVLVGIANRHPTWTKEMIESFRASDVICNPPRESE